jgi:hypothetical protein
MSAICCLSGDREHREHLNHFSSHDLNYATAMGVEGRRKVVFHFLDTEKAYIRDVAVFQRVFVEPLNILLVREAKKSKRGKALNAISLFLDTFTTIFDSSS